MQNSGCHGNTRKSLKSSCLKLLANLILICVCNVPLTAKVIMEMGPQFKVSSHRLLKLGIELAIYKASDINTTLQWFLYHLAQNLIDLQLPYGKIV